MKKLLLLLFISFCVAASSGVLIDPNYFCSSDQFTATSVFTSGLSANQNWIPASGQLTNSVHAFSVTGSYFGNGGSIASINVAQPFLNPRVVVRINGKWFYSNLLTSQVTNNQISIIPTTSRNVFEPNDYGLLFDKFLPSNGVALSDVIVPFTNNRKIVYMTLNEINSLPPIFFDDLDKHFYDASGIQDFRFTTLMLDPSYAAKVSSDSISLIKLICTDPSLVDAIKSKDLVSSDAIVNLMVKELPFVDTSFLNQKPPMLFAARSANLPSATRISSTDPLFVKTDLTAAFFYSYLLQEKDSNQIVVGQTSNLPDFSQVISKYESLKIETNTNLIKTENSGKIDFNYLPLITGLFTVPPTVSISSKSFYVSQNNLRSYSTAEVSIPLYSYGLFKNPEAATPEYLAKINDLTSRLTQVNIKINSILLQLESPDLNQSTKTFLNLSYVRYFNEQVYLNQKLFDLRKSEFSRVSLGINALGSFETVTPKEISSTPVQGGGFTLNPDRFVYGATVNLNLNPYYVSPLDYNAFSGKVYGGLVLLTSVKNGVTPSYGLLLGTNIYYDKLNVNGRFLFNPNLDEIVQRRSIDLNGFFDTRWRPYGVPDLLLYFDYSRLATKGELASIDNPAFFQSSSAGIGVSFNNFKIFTGATSFSSDAFKGIGPTLKIDYTDPDILGGALKLTGTASLVQGSSNLGLGLSFSPNNIVIEKQITTMEKDQIVSESNAGYLTPQVRMMVHAFDTTGKNLEFSSLDDFNKKSKNLKDLHVPYEYEFFTQMPDGSVKTTTGSGVTGTYTDDYAQVGSLAAATIYYNGKTYDALPLIPGSESGSVSGLLTGDENKNVFYALVQKLPPGNCIVPVRLLIKPVLKQTTVKKEPLFFIYDNTKSMTQEIQAASHTLTDLVQKDSLASYYDINVILLEESNTPQNRPYSAINKISLHSFSDYANLENSKDFLLTYSRTGKAGFPEDYYSAIKLALSKIDNNGRIIILGDALPRGGINNYAYDYQLPEPVTDKQISFSNDIDLGYFSSDNLNAVRTSAGLTTDRILQSLILKNVKLDYINFPHSDSSPDLVQAFWSNFTNKEGGNYYSYSSTNDFKELFANPEVLQTSTYSPPIYIDASFLNKNDNIDANLPLVVPAKRVYDSSVISSLDLNVKSTTFSKDTLNIIPYIIQNGRKVLLSSIVVPFTGKDDCSPPRSFDGEGDKGPLTKEVLIPESYLISS
ncbi:Uncharacterised protein [uncultured archaeon]|nr:Uncharacterised protein [uncultured archaeon]